MKRYSIAVFLVGITLITAGAAGAETKQEYENRFQVMFDFAVRLDDHVRSHLGDKKLAAYACAMAERNALEAEQMTPPDLYRQMHPHFILVLENIERSFHFVAKGRLDGYRRHQKVVRKEIQLLEALAEQANMGLYLFERRY